MDVKDYLYLCTRNNEGKMTKRMFLLLLLALCCAAGANAKKVDRGLGNPKSVYIPKGTVALGGTVGYNRFNATGENSSTGGTLVSLVTDLNGNIGMLTASAGVSWFFADNLSMGLRAGYVNTAVDVNNASLMSSLSFSNKHIVSQIFNGALAFRGYIPLFNSKVVALFGEARLTGGFGFSKDYAETSRGKEGTYADLYNITLGLYPGVSVFVTNGIAFEISLPLLEGGYEWNLQTKGEAHDSELSHGFANFKPSLLGLNLGIVFHF